MSGCSFDCCVTVSDSFWLRVDSESSYLSSTILYCLNFPGKISSTKKECLASKLGFDENSLDYKFFQCH